MKKNKRGLSPVVTTVLLIALVVILAIIILLWAIAFIPESILKGERAIESVCDDVAFEASFKDIPETNEDEIWVSNNGNVNIHAFEVGFYLEGDVSKEEVVPQDIGGGEPITLRQGVSGKMTVDVPKGTTKITLLPILIGTVGEREVKYLCKNHPGEELIIA